MGKKNHHPKKRTVRFQSKSSAEDFAKKYGVQVKKCIQGESGNFKVKIPNLANEDVRKRYPHLLSLAGGKYSERRDDDYTYPEEYWR